MANKTFIPAFKSTVGDWNYYICQMKYAEVARQIGFAFELGGNQDLNTMIQRGLSDRTEAITQYLESSEHRFLGALIVATWGGDPEYVPLTMEDPDGMLSGVDREFGVLTLDGTHQFFALDGQHRLKAIKEAVRQKPELGAEDIAVLLVPHYDSKDGRERTRRLFTNINRNAKTTTAAENIALDVDDGFAVMTRDLLTTHPLLSKPGVVRVFVSPPGREGEVRLAAANIPKADPRAWTTITVLYDMLRALGFGLDPAMKDLSKRPADDVLQESEKLLTKRLDDLLKNCGDLRKKLESAASARDVRAPKNSETEGHAFMRPVVQRVVTRALQQIVEQEERTWEELTAQLSALDWRICRAPWIAIYNTDTEKIVSAKENAELLANLLYVHLAPQSAQEIKRARKSYRDVVGKQYPVTEAQLESGLKTAVPKEQPSGDQPAGD
jgi:DNA sulfur modification protein DndB